MKNGYDDDFYLSLDELKRTSGRAAVPLVMKWIAPKSVMDVGCGIC